MLEKDMKLLTVLAAATLLVLPASARPRQEDSTKVASQNPSPMTESTRKHARIEQTQRAGTRFLIPDVLPKPASVFVPQRRAGSKSFDVLIHFHGAGYVTENAAERSNGAIIGVTINLGSGSKAYNDAFRDSTTFGVLLDSIRNGTERALGHRFIVRHTLLSGFSAGYGAIRRILSSQENYARVDGVLLLDGIHTSYIPERRVLAEGGRIDSTGLLTFLRLARDASGRSSHKKFLITHSEIFPGTFVSTTESTDFLLNNLSLHRTPVLRWGPLGMQQISSVRKGHFEIMGFAGNAGPDHVDHLQSLFWFLSRLRDL